MSAYLFAAAATGGMALLGSILVRRWAFPERRQERRSARGTIVTFGAGPRPLAKFTFLPANRNSHQLEFEACARGINRRAVYEELQRMGYLAEIADVNNWPLNPFGKKPSMLKSLDPLRALRLLIARPRPDIVVSYFESGVVFLVLLQRLFFFRVPIAIVDIGIASNSRLREIFLRFVIPRVAVVFTFSSNQVEYIQNNYDTKNTAVEFLTQQVDTVFFHGDSSGAGNYILSVGDDISRDFGTILQAVEGLDLDLVLKTRLVREDRKTYPTISIVNARLNDREFRELYARARFVVIAVHSTVTAGGITTLLESMAMGKAVIVSDSEGLRDYIQDGVTALKVPCNDPAALRAAILRLEQDEAERTRLGQNARRYAEDHLTQAIHARTLADRLTAIAGIKQSAR